VDEVGQVGVSGEAPTGELDRALVTDDGRLVTTSRSADGDQLTDALGDVATDEFRMRLYGEDDAGALAEAQFDTLDASLAGTEVAQLTYLARALDSQGIDEFVSRVTDSNGAQIDPLTQDVLQSVSADQLRVDLQNNNAGPLATEQQSPVGIEDTTGTLIDLLTQAVLQSVATDQVRVDIESNNAGTLATEQQSPVGVEDSTGTQVDPSVATSYLDSQTTQYDLVASGDLVIGPAQVERGTAVVIAATSTDNNTFSVSVRWPTETGTSEYQTESAADIGLDTITEDYARLVRKGPQVEVTVTDESGAAQNIINIHADTER
jgi:hypothetical protein